MTNELHHQTWRNIKPPTLPEHLFAIGQFVRMRNDPPMFSKGRGEFFRITALMPRSSDVPQYRIRNERELHERMVAQDKLEPVAISETTKDNELLIAKTFEQE